MQCDYCSLVELAGQLETSYQRLYRWAVAGKIPARRIGKAWVVPMQEIHFIKSCVTAADALQKGVQWSRESSR